MRIRRIIYFAICTMIAASLHADGITIVSNVLGPEGPLFVDRNLYYVGWISNTLSRWDGKTTTVLNHTPGCGHNGLALTKQKTFLIACFDHGAILEVDMNGKQLRRWETDSKGQKFEGGINDVVVTPKGDAYATVFGPFVDPPTLVVGKILYLALGSQKWIEVADDLNYANGIAVSPDQNTLYVNETVGNSIKKFTIHDDGALSDRSNFAQLNLLTKNKVEAWWIGPDSIRQTTIDSKTGIKRAPVIATTSHSYFDSSKRKADLTSRLSHLIRIDRSNYPICYNPPAWKPLPVQK